MWYIPYDFLKSNFTHFNAKVRLFFVQKRKPKIFGFKNVMERGIKKFSLSQYVKLHLKFSGKQYWISKDLSSPRMTEQMQIFMAPLKMHFSVKI